VIDPETIPDSALQRLGGALTELLDDDHWNNVEKNFLLPALEERADLADLVGRLVRHLKKADPSDVLPRLADEYLKNHNLVSPLR
jgi:hypothetical protein